MDCSTAGFPVFHHLPFSRACSNSCPLSPWYYPAILSSVLSLSSCLQYFPASGSFLMSRLFTSGGQSIGASDSVLPMNIQDWFPFRLTGCSPRYSQESSPTPQFKSINSLVLSLLYDPTLTSVHDCWKTETALTIWTFVGKVMYLLF